MATQSAQNIVSSAIYNILAPGDAPEPGLAALGVTGVYDLRGVPQNATFDYIIIGDCIEQGENTLGRRGYMLTYTIRVWSRGRGTSYATAIISRINQLLDQQPLTLSGHTHVFTMLIRDSWRADPDGITVQGAVQYKIYTQEG